MKRYIIFIIFIINILIMTACTSEEAVLPVSSNSKSINATELRENLPSLHEIEFSEPSGFYSDILILELENRTDDSFDIRYTTDGSEPTASSNIYTNAIRKSAGNDASNITSLVVRAALFDGEKIASDIYTNSYILGYKIEERFDVPIVCISTGPDNLWNHEYGIFADGKLREEWRNANPRVRDWTTIFTAPANWWAKGREWERPAYVEIFEPDGTRVVAQDAGVRIHGGWSRGNETQKSLRIFARNEYDPVKTYFDYEIFPNNTSRDGTNKLITSYKRLVLRNGGNDFGNTRIRDEVSQDIAALYGLDVQNSRAGIIFLNGELYGIIQIKQPHDRFTLKDVYNAPDDDFTIMEQATSSGGYRVMNGDPVEEEKYAELVREISRGTARDEAGRKQIEEQMDVYSILKYYAFQIYIGNGDWPHNNFKLYKYNVPELNTAGADGLDGRWRYMLFDTDFGMGLSGDHNVNILSSCMNNKGDGGLFAGLMQSEEYKNMFVKLICDLINVYYTHDNVYYYIGARSLEIAGIIPLQQSRTDWNRNVTIMYDWVERRPAVMYRHLDRILKLVSDDLYQINLTQNTDGGSVYINEFMLTDKNWTGHHYFNTGAEMRAIPLPGWKLEKWIVNGKDISDTVMKLDGYVSSGNVNIEAVFVKDDSLEGTLVINEIYYDNNGYGYIELYNPTNSEVSAELYSLAIHNRNDNTKTMIEFDEKIAAPFSYITVDVNDSLKSGKDEIILMRSDEIQESVCFPELKNGENYGRYPDGGGFVYLQKNTRNTKNELNSERITEYEYMKNRVMLTGRIQNKAIIPIRENGDIYIPLAVLEEYNGNNPASMRSTARKNAVNINGEQYVPLSVFENTHVRINDVILERLNSVIIYK